MLIARAAINEGFDATHIPSYGPESRGGTSLRDVRIAEDEVLSPAAPAPHLLVAFNGAWRGSPPPGWWAAPLSTTGR
jgi:Pyruvate/2-oxoacid:ferredoxin oxidoreductase gamma subunit